MGLPVACASSVALLPASAHAFISSIVNQGLWMPSGREAPDSSSGTSRDALQATSPSRFVALMVYMPASSFSTSLISSDTSPYLFVMEILPPVVRSLLPLNHWTSGKGKPDIEALKRTVPRMQQRLF